MGKRGTLGTMSPFFVVTPSPSSVEQFIAVYEKSASGLFWHCRQHVSDPEVARELVQDAFVRTWEYLQQGKQVDSMKTFLYKVLNNLIVDYARKCKRQHEVSLDALQEMGFDPGRDDTDELRRNVDMWKTMLHLTDSKEYDLLTMRYVEGLRTTDIAKATGIAPNTVSVKIHRIVRELMRKLGVRTQARKRKKNMVVIEHKNNT